MSKAKFDATKQLIQEKKYDQARALLQTIDHPTAAKWLEKLDEIAPHPKPKRKWTARKIFLLMILSVPTTCILFAVLSAIGGQAQQQAVKDTALKLAVSMRENCSVFSLDGVKEQVCQQAAESFRVCGTSASTFQVLEVCKDTYDIAMCSLISTDATAVEKCVAQSKDGP